jgi:putative toxin-antitoxin system antitoxin component (TIGR02293 family)
MASEEKVITLQNSNAETEGEQRELGRQHRLKQVLKVLQIARNATSRKAGRKGRRSRFSEALGEAGSAFPVNVVLQLSDGSEVAVPLIEQSDSDSHTDAVSGSKALPRTMKEAVDVWARTGRRLPEPISPHQVAEALGGRASVKAEVKTETDLIQLTRRGLPFQAGQHLQRRLQITAHELARMVEIGPRTLSRRKSARFTSTESDRLIRVARVFATALAVLGEEDRAVQWLRHPSRALGGVAPMEQLNIESGARQVERLLGALEHGVYA